MKPIGPRANLGAWNVSVQTGPFDFRDPPVIAYGIASERERIIRLSPEQVERELARLDCASARRFIDLMSERQLDALVGNDPELAELSDVELLALANGAGE